MNAENENNVRLHNPFSSSCHLISDEFIGREKDVQDIVQAAEAGPADEEQPT